MAVIEVMSIKQWQSSIKQRFGMDNIEFRNNETNMMAFMARNISTSILIGRYDKYSQKGRIFDRRALCRA